MAGMVRTRTKSRNSGAVSFTVDASGLRGITEILKAMPRTMQTGIIKPTVDSLTKKGARDARANLLRILPRRDPKTRRWDRPTGVLADSLGAKTVPLSKMRNKDIVFGMFGARSGFRVTVPTRGRVARIRRVSARPLAVGRIIKPDGRVNQRGGAIQPTKYLHLVERGHKAVPQHRIPAARPYPFIAPARASLQAAAPGIIRSEWNRRYSSVVGRMSRRYARRAGLPGGRA